MHLREARAWFIVEHLEKPVFEPWLLSRCFPTPATQFPALVPPWGGCCKATTTVGISQTLLGQLHGFHVTRRRAPELVGLVWAARNHMARTSPLSLSPPVSLKPRIGHPPRPVILGSCNLAVRSKQPCAAQGCL